MKRRPTSTKDRGQKQVNMTYLLDDPSLKILESIQGTTPGVKIGGAARELLAERLELFESGWKWGDAAMLNLLNEICQRPALLGLIGKLSKSPRKLADRLDVLVERPKILNLIDAAKDLDDAGIDALIATARKRKG